MMSNELGDEGTSGNANAQVNQGMGGATGIDGDGTEFIDEVERVLRSKEQSLEERWHTVAVTWSCLGWGATMYGRAVCGARLFILLREKRFWWKAQCLQAFYNRKQSDGKDLCGYFHAVSQIMSSILTQLSDNTISTIW